MGTAPRGASRTGYEPRCVRQHQRESSRLEVAPFRSCEHPTKARYAPTTLHQQAAKGIDATDHARSPITSGLLRAGSDRWGLCKEQAVASW